MSYIDKATGLPALPDGYFWRVKRFGVGGYPLEVQLRHRVLFFSTLVASELSGNGRTSIFNAARNAHQQWRYSVATAEYVGDYPPKTLGASDD